MSMSLIDSTGRAMIQEKTIPEQVDSVLEKNAIVMTCYGIGTRKREDWDCDAWNIEFKNTKSGKVENFEYFTGSGLRAELTARQKALVRRGFPGLTDNDLKNNSGYAKRFRAACESARKPKSPDAASVLNSLVLDSASIHQSFNNWCSDYGYDSDSRKAYSIYEACQKNSDKLESIFPARVIAELSGILQDF